MERFIKKAAVLTEALPYIKSFQGKTFVIKYGGSTLGYSEVVRNICLDLVFLKCVGIHPVLVHGGGPDITREMQRLGKKPHFVHGMRVTDAETLRITAKVMKKINAELVGLLAKSGGTAQGIADKKGTALFLKARKKYHKDEKGNKQDLGFVGEVTRVDTGRIKKLINSPEAVIPVVAPLGQCSDGQYYNINADHVAAEVAVALQAHKVVFLTDVQGILVGKGKRQKLASSLTRVAVEKLIKQGVIHGGMIPKVKSCLRALKAGVAKAHMVDGRVMHSILLEIFTDKGVGTQILH